MRINVQAFDVMVMMMIVDELALIINSKSEHNDYQINYADL